MQDNIYRYIKKYAYEIWTDSRTVYITSYRCAMLDEAGQSDAHVLHLLCIVPWLLVVAPNRPSFMLCFAKRRRENRKRKFEEEKKERRSKTCKRTTDAVTAICIHSLTTTTKKTRDGLPINSSTRLINTRPSLRSSMMLDMVSPLCAKMKFAQFVNICRVSKER